MTDGGGDDGLGDSGGDDEPKEKVNDKEHTTFLDVINGTGEISLKDDKIQAALPPKPKIEQLYMPYSQMYVNNSSMMTYRLIITNYIKAISLGRCPRFR